MRPPLPGLQQTSISSLLVFRWSNTVKLFYILPIWILFQVKVKIMLLLSQPWTNNIWIQRTHGDSVNKTNMGAALWLWWWLGVVWWGDKRSCIPNQISANVPYSSISIFECRSVINVTVSLKMSLKWQCSWSGQFDLKKLSIKMFHLQWAQK